MGGGVRFTKFWLGRLVLLQSQPHRKSYLSACLKTQINTHTHCFVKNRNFT